MEGRLVVHTSAEGRRKSLGQHYLHSESVINAIVQACKIQAADIVWEIGCGDGALTLPLQHCGAGFLGVVEYDPMLVQAMREQWPSQRVVHADAKQFLQQVNEATAPQYPVPTIIVSNLPYSSGTAIFQNMFLPAYGCTRLVLMFQKEVAHRVLGRSRAAVGPLSILSNLLYIVRKVRDVGPGAFAPPPKVDSMVIHLTPKEGPECTEIRANIRPFWHFVCLCFSQRRKTLRNNLKGSVATTSLPVATQELLRLRPEALDAHQFWELFCICRKL